MKQDTLEGKARTKNGVKRLCFSIICILLEVIFIITIVTRLIVSTKTPPIFLVQNFSNDLKSLLWRYKDRRIFGVKRDQNRLVMHHAIAVGKELCLGSVSYTHLDVYKRQIPAHIARGILQSSAMQRTIGTHKI